ncbi:MAG TPA: OB-fold domain-containing protein, partial [Mycobacterium sp.]|nr:OB-fold domain-containing protein [Mycobacterium sp.]
MTRPLPELTFLNEFFWTAGSDNILRIQECRDCTALIHPPQPVCRYCRSHNMGVRDVSGKATVSAFTVNHRFGFPDLPPPYVVAQVAIVEDPRVRLTTNIVDCDPDELELGQLVEVAFEKLADQAGAVFLPVFRPTTQKQTGPLPEDEIAPQD